MSNNLTLFAETTTHGEDSHSTKPAEETEAGTSAHAEEAHTSEASEGHGEEAGGLSSFGLDPFAFALQLGAIIIFYFLIRKFALKKIVATLDERHQTIDEGLKNAEKAAAAVADAEVRQEEILAKARKQADDVIGKAHEEAGVMLKEAEDRTADKTAKMIEDAQNKIEADVKKAKASLQGEVKSLVAQATEAIINEKIDDKKDAALIEKAIKESA